jgi:hypothetical protein
MTDPGRGIHIGNVAEFNKQFFAPEFSPEHFISWARESNHYACLACFYSANPTLIFLPFRLDQRWIDLLRERLSWTHAVQIFDGLDAGPSLSTVILERPELLALVVESGDELLAWGVAPEFQRLCSTVATLRGAFPASDASCMPSVMDVATKCESKAGSHDLFECVCAVSNAFAIPGQVVARSLADAATALAARAGTGAVSVLKSEFGVGGFGTVVVEPDQAASEATALRFLQDLIAEDNIFLCGALVVEDYVPHAAGTSDLTFDAVIHPDGSVEVVGLGIMQVVGTKYIGVTVGPDVDRMVHGAAITEFGLGVGRRMADAGYRGWFDIDFVLGQDGRIYPTEINARRTGPTIAHALRLRYESMRPQSDHTVRTLDLLKLPHPLAEEVLFEHVRSLDVMMRPLGVEVVPTLVSASTEAEEEPYFGVALVTASSEVGVLDRSEELLLAANAAL